MASLTPYMRYKQSGRYYADLRPYADVGGRCHEPLVAPGEKRPTTDRAIAATLLAARIRALEEARRQGVVLGRKPKRTLAQAVARHLSLKAESGRFSHSWLASNEMMLRRAVAHFGAGRDLTTLAVADVQGYLNALRTTAVSRGHKTKKQVLPSDGTLRHHLNALSNLYRRAISEGWVPPGFNPATALMDKPSGKHHAARWLEVEDAALLLEAARTLPPVAAHLKSFDPAFTHALLATFLLTGGRESEVLGLEVDDISFERQTVTIRPNGWRRVKTEGSARVLPLWPQLAEVLRPYIWRPQGRLLFPSYLGSSGAAEAMITDWRKVLDRVAERAGWKKGEIRSRMFRHTYCAARLQTLDGGAPVSPFTVSRELGHGSRALVEKVYGHLGTVRHRAEEVEYRVEQHRARLAERLATLEA